MKLKHMLNREICLFFGKPFYLIVPCVFTLCTGLITWLTCDGIQIVWRITKHPSFAPPLWLLFIMWTFVYVLYGVIISYSLICGLKSGLSLSAIVSYFAALFWCPIMLTAGVGICGVCTLVLSGVYLFRVGKVIGMYSILTSVSVFLTCIFEIYMICFSIGCAVLN